jgi:hypothetical protein
MAMSRAYERLDRLIHYRFVDIKAFATLYVMDAFSDVPAGMTPLLTSGQSQYGEEFIEGVDNLPAPLLTFFDDSHSGKTLIVRND